MVRRPGPQCPRCPFVRQVVEKSSNVRVEHPVHSLRLDSYSQRVQRLVRVATWPEPVREAFEVHLVDLVEDGHHRLLDDLVFQRCDAQRALPPSLCRYGPRTRAFANLFQLSAVGLKPCFECR
jgi:hypothetical protein